MSWLGRSWLRIRALLGKAHAEHELDDELRFHLEKQIEANIAAGMAPEEARRRALARFGGVEQVKEECRDARGLRLLEDLAQDIRYGLRQLRRTPGFTAVAVLTLALGIGANTAIFSVVNAVLFRPLPFPESDRLMSIWEFKRKEGHRASVSALNFAGWRERQRVFSQIAAYQYANFVLSGAGEPERLVGAKASPSLFSILGVQPALGRNFLPSEEMQGADRVVVLTHQFWTRRFGADPRVLGRWLNLNGESFRVAGVLPAHFAFPGARVDLWTPLALDLRGLKGRIRYLAVVGRLRPGVGIDQAQAGMDTVARALEAADPERNAGQGASVMPMKEQVVGDFRDTILTLFGCVAVVLLIACANVANLLLGRATARQKEMAVRISLGAGRFRVMRQLLTESVLLSALGGLLGFLMSHWAVKLLVALDSEIPRAPEIAPDGQVLAFTAAVSLVGGLVFGCLPAYRCSKPDVGAVLKGGPVPSRNRWRGLAAHWPFPKSRCL